METVCGLLDKLKIAGYDSNIRVHDGLILTNGGEVLPLENICLDQTHRIEDDSDPTHQTIIFAISCSYPQKKGVLVNSFGIYSEQDKNAVIEKIYKCS